MRRRTLWRAAGLIVGVPSGWMGMRHPLGKMIFEPSSIFTSAGVARSQSMIAWSGNEGTISPRYSKSIGTRIRSLAVWQVDEAGSRDEADVVVRLPADPGELRKVAAVAGDIGKNTQSSGGSCPPLPPSSMPTSSFGTRIA